MPDPCQTSSLLHSTLAFFASLPNRCVTFCKRCSFIVIPNLRNALAATSKEGQSTDIDTQISRSAGLIFFIMPRISRPRCRNAPLLRLEALPRFLFGFARRNTGEYTFQSCPDFRRILISRYSRKRQAHWPAHCFNIAPKNTSPKSSFSLATISRSAISWYLL